MTWCTREQGVLEGGVNGVGRGWEDAGWGWKHFTPHFFFTFRNKSKCTSEKLCEIKRNRHPYSADQFYSFSETNVRSRQTLRQINHSMRFSLKWNANVDPVQMQKQDKTNSHVVGLFQASIQTNIDLRTSTCVNHWTVQPSHTFAGSKPRNFAEHAPNLPRSYYGQFSEMHYHGDHMSSDVWAQVSAD